jgi:hypothetical protein
LLSKFLVEDRFSNNKFFEGIKTIVSAASVSAFTKTEIGKIYYFYGF